MNKYTITIIKIDSESRFKCRSEPLEFEDANEIMLDYLNGGGIEVPSGNDCTVALSEAFLSDCACYLNRIED